MEPCEGVPPRGGRALTTPSLPTELACLALRGLDGSELAASRRVCRSWAHLADSAARQLARQPWEQHAAAVPLLGRAASALSTAIAALSRVDDAELRAVQTFCPGAPPLLCGPLLLAVAELVPGHSWDSAAFLRTLQLFTESCIPAPELLRIENKLAVRLRAALTGTHAGAAGASALAQHREAEAHGFHGLKSTIGSVAYLHAWLERIVEASVLVCRARRSALVIQRLALVSAMRGVGRPALGRQLLELDRSLVQDAASLNALRAVLVAQPLLRDGLVAGRHACTARTRLPPDVAGGCASAAPQPVLSREDLCRALDGVNGVKVVSEAHRLQIEVAGSGQDTLAHNRSPTDDTVC
jgi:hypothetical protein